MATTVAISKSVEDDAWHIYCDEHVDYDYFGRYPYCTHCSNGNPDPEIKLFKWEDIKRAALLDSFQPVELSRTMLSVDDAMDGLRSVLSNKRSTLFGRAYEIVGEKSLELAVRELFFSLIAPTLCELDLLPGTVQNGQWVPTSD